MNRFRNAFDTLWADGEFEIFNPRDEGQCLRVRLALEAAGKSPGQRNAGPPVFFDLRPHPYQRATLDGIESERLDRGDFRNFVAAPSRFHWQSQSTTSEDSPAGQRYANQAGDSARFLLFVRARSEEPFVFLGPLGYVSHTGSRPMSTYWDLKHEIPAWFFEICASLDSAAA